MAPYFPLISLAAEHSLSFRLDYFGLLFACYNGNPETEKKSAERQSQFASKHKHLIKARPVADGTRNKLLSHDSHDQFLRARPILQRSKVAAGVPQLRPNSMPSICGEWTFVSIKGNSCIALRQCSAKQLCGFSPLYPTNQTGISKSNDVLVKYNAKSSSMSRVHSRTFKGRCQI
ncbi:hypothetical protein PO909_019130 [Leuciscus waleckii]